LADGKKIRKRCLHEAFNSLSIREDIMPVQGGLETKLESGKRIRLQNEESTARNRRGKKDWVEEKRRSLILNGKRIGR